ncbi:MAG: plasmid stabilization protein [Azospirillaceae bacterium]
MINFTIRNLDPALARRLRARAAEHDRSLEGEARAILGDAVGDHTPPRDLAAAIRSRVSAVGGVELEIPGREAMRALVRFGDPRR